MAVISINQSLIWLNQSSLTKRKYVNKSSALDLQGTILCQICFFSSKLQNFHKHFDQTDKLNKWPINYIFIKGSASSIAGYCKAEVPNSNLIAGQKFLEYPRAKISMFLVFTHPKGFSPNKQVKCVKFPALRAKWKAFVGHRGPYVVHARC